MQVRLKLRGEFLITSKLIINSPTRVRVIFPDTSSEESFAAVAAGGTVMFPCRSITADRAHIAAAVAIGDADQLQVLHVFHNCWRRRFIFRV